MSTGLLLRGHEGATVQDEQQTAAMATEAAHGNPEAVDLLLPRVYDQLRAVAAALIRNERPDHTLQPTALVHEAYLKLVGRAPIDERGRTHLLAIAARAMRQILVDHARRHNAVKRGGGCVTIRLDEKAGFFQGRRVDFSHVNEALDRLARLQERKSQVVELRFFGGMSHGQIAEFLGVSVSTVEQDWRVARAWLARELSRMESR